MFMRVTACLPACLLLAFVCLYWPGKKDEGKRTRGCLGGVAVAVPQHLADMSRASLIIYVLVLGAPDKT